MSDGIYAQRWSGNAGDAAVWEDISPLLNEIQDSASQGPPAVLVSELDGQTWEASNPSVVLTPDGVKFGPYADGAAAAGSIRYHGLDGQPFSEVKNAAYHLRWTTDDKNPDPGCTPYFRVFTQDDAGNAHDAIFTPGSQDFRGVGPGPFTEYVATSGTWRWDSDDGSNSEFGNGVPLDQVLAKYGDQQITRLSITCGWTAAANLAALLRWMQINGTRYTFGG